MMVLAIDGPAGSGKSTVARRLAERLGLAYLDTGAMYRAMTFAVLQRGLDPADAEAVADLADRVEMAVGDREVTVDGVDATAAIRGPEVTSAVSEVAANPAVRTELVARQRAWVDTRGGGVVEGRDIGTVVFPDATLKLYLTARPEVRARRRAGEIDGAEVEAIAADIDRRDRADSKRAVSPLRMAGDACEVDTSDLGVDAIVEHILELLP